MPKKTPLFLTPQYQRLEPTAKANMHNEMMRNRARLSAQWARDFKLRN